MYKQPCEQCPAKPQPEQKRWDLVTKVPTWTQDAMIFKSTFVLISWFD